MFSTLGLFNNVACPMGNDCEFISCIFTHREARPARPLDHGSTVKPTQSFPNKRIKLDDGSSANPASARPGSRPFVGRLVHDSPTPPSELDEGRPVDEMVSVAQDGLASSVRGLRSISPPPLKRALASQASTPSTNGATSQATIAKIAPDNNAIEVPEVLNPRMMIKPPAPHTSRSLYLKKLYEYMKRLNDLTKESADPATKQLSLNNGQLIKLALDEEERIAIENFSVYGNMIKLRMVALSKMTVEQWKEGRLELKPQHKSAAIEPTEERDLTTGLSPIEEVQLLPRLLADQNILAPHGLVISPPTDDDIAAAREGVETAPGHETCDRCGSRFQVFPERRDDGALTSGGACTHHHGRVFTTDGRGPGTGAVREKRYSCCNESLGSTGCVTSETHVFKVNDKKRLASILQFKHTPENPGLPQDRAVCFDCEMGYTVHGMEMIRLTATSWPTNEELIDVLVKPLGAVLDLNTRFSGVSFDDFTNATPFDGTKDTVEDSDADTGKKRPRIVNSPLAARELLFSLISPSSPLIGHAIDNDLNVTRIIHPSIIDTVLLFPHRAGLPFRPALRVLAKERLRRIIQAGGPSGHDSKEDAIAAGDLVRLVVGRDWRKMKQSGWRFDKGKLVEPTKPIHVVKALKEIVHEEMQQTKSLEKQVDILEY